MDELWDLTTWGSSDWDLDLLWGWSTWGWSWGGSDTSEVTGEETSLFVGFVEWVNEGVDTFTASAGWDEVLLNGVWVQWVETGSVGVELEVSVGWVVWVDEWVSVWVDWGVVVVDIGKLGLGNLLGLDLDLLGLWAWLWSWLWLSDTLNWLDWLFDFGSGDSWVKSGSVQTVSAVWNVGTIEDSEAVLASGVFDSVSLTVITDVRVLTYSFS